MEPGEGAAGAGPEMEKSPARGTEDAAVLVPEQQSGALEQQQVKGPSFSPWRGQDAAKGSPLGVRVEGRGEAFEAGAEGGRVAADADAEMAGHFEEAAGDDGGFKFLAEQF